MLELFIRFEYFRQTLGSQLLEILPRVGHKDVPFIAIPVALAATFLSPVILIAPVGIDAIIVAAIFGIICLLTIVLAPVALIVF